MTTELLAVPRNSVHEKQNQWLRTALARSSFLWEWDCVSVGNMNQALIVVVPQYSKALSKMPFLDPQNTSRVAGQIPTYLKIPWCLFRVEGNYHSSLPVRNWEVCQPRELHNIPSFLRNLGPRPLEASCASVSRAPVAWTIVSSHPGPHSLVTLQKANSGIQENFKLLLPLLHNIFSWGQHSISAASPSQVVWLYICII